MDLDPKSKKLPQKKKKM